MLKKVSALALVLFIVCSMCSIPAFGYTVFISEDFEDFSPERWSYSSSIFGEENGNTYMVLNNTDTNNRMIMMEDTRTPAPEFFVSADFMIPEDGSTLVQVLGSTYRAGKGEGCHVWYDNGVLKLGYSTSPIDVVVAEGIETGKWYNVFAHIDHSASSETPKFTVYFGETKTAEQTFATAITGPASQGCGYVGRWFVTRENTGKDAYIDNILVVPVENFDLEVELFKAHSIVMNADVGYEDGQYPESAVNMFDDTYNTILTLAESGGINGDNYETYVAELADALDVFENSKIDSSDTSTETSYIRINESGDMTNACATYPGEDFVMTLEANPYTKSGVLTDTEVTWSVDVYDERVKIQGDQLIVNPGFEGDIVLKAEAGDVYAIHKLSVVSIRGVTVTSISGTDGLITIEGSVSDRVSSAVNIEVTSNEVGGGISFIDVIDIESDNSFVWTSEVSEDVNYQYFTAVISGTEIIEKTYEGYYYKDGWEESVTAEINEAEAGALGRILNIHSEALFVDTQVLDLYSDDYCARIVAGGEYADINAICDVIDETELVVLHANVTRSDIEELVINNTALLKKNGFDIAKLDKLTSEKKRTFYLNAATIEIDARTSSAEDIADEYDVIFDALTSKGGSSGGSSGGSISSGVHEGSSSEDRYAVSLVGGTASAEPSREEVENFADVDSSAWYAPALAYMKKNGIMEGDGRNVRPSEAITRGEFSKIVVTAFGLSAEGDNASFSDAKGTWWAEYANVAAACGIVNGMGDGTFAGDSEITREMLAVIIDRAIIAKNIELYDQNDGVEFVDEEYFADYAVEAIARLGQKGIVSGIGEGIFAPRATVTRAEAAQIIYNVLKNL